MNSGSGVFNSINEITKPIIDLVSNNKDTIKHVAETVINAVKVGQNTREIVNSIINSSKHHNLTESENLKGIIKRIRKLKTTGSGFAYT